MCLFFSYSQSGFVPWFAKRGKLVFLRIPNSSRVSLFPAFTNFQNIFISFENGNEVAVSFLGNAYCDGKFGRAYVALVSFTRTLHYLLPSRSSQRREQRILVLSHTFVVHVLLVNLC